MTVVVAPQTELVVDQNGSNFALANTPYQQALPTGSVITWGWASGAQASGANDFDADLYDMATGSPVALRAGTQLWSGLSGGASYSVTLAGPALATLLLFAGGAGGHHSAGTLFGFHAEVITPTGFCEYGTRIQPAQSTVLVITEATIAAAAVIVPELAIFAVIWGAFVGWTYVPGSVCTGPPPDVPTFTDADFLFGAQIPAPGSIPKFWLALQAALWRIYCECVPAPGGFPDPTPFPPPTVGPPPSGIPTPPGPIVCDGSDICATLNTIMAQIRVLAAQLAYTRADVQLIQRQHVPFAYLPGTLHSGLSGSGTIAVNAILGLSIQSTSIPPTLSSDMAPVQSWFKLGEVSWGTADGWTARRIVTHNPHLFLDVDGDVTTVGYLFEPGVVANILELLREP